MKIKLKTLSLTTYDNDSKKKYKFAKEMADDPLISNFVSRNLVQELINSHDDSEVLIGSAYLVCDKKLLIGYLKLDKLDIEGVLTIHYAVHPDYRKMKYGSKILDETAYYVLHNINEVKKLKLKIVEINKSSIECAKHCGYKKESESAPNIKMDRKVVYTKKIR